jgi:hypothetical protein
LAGGQLPLAVRRRLLELLQQRAFISFSRHQLLCQILPDKKKGVADHLSNAY